MSAEVSHLLRFHYVILDLNSICRRKHITRPAWALIDLPLSVLDKMPSVSGLTVQGPIRINLDVRITYNNQLKDEKNMHNK